MLKNSHTKYRIIYFSYIFLTNKHYKNTNIANAISTKQFYAIKIQSVICLSHWAHVNVKLTRKWNNSIFQSFVHVNSLQETHWLFIRDFYNENVSKFIETFDFPRVCCMRKRSNMHRTDSEIYFIHNDWWKNCEVRLSKVSYESL